MRSRSPYRKVETIVYVLSDMPSLQVPAVTVNVNTLPSWLPLISTPSASARRVPCIATPCWSPGVL
ncbi:MAG: hypothetical protein IPF45_02665 [Thermomonas sp.]|nr:hypothetical protein [Thermomonas sp.]